MMKKLAKWILLPLLTAGMLGACAKKSEQAEEPAEWKADFESAVKTPEGWEIQGRGVVDTHEAFKGAKALLLSKTEKTLRDKETALSPLFPVSSGMLDVQYATKTELVSMDNSYNAGLDLEFFDAQGKPLGKSELATWFRGNAWSMGRSKVEAPEGAASARFVATINKETPGKYWLDELSVRKVVDGRPDDGLRRMIFTASRIGHLLLPGDSRMVKVEVWSTKELPEALLDSSFSLRDYWGAEQAKPIRTRLAAAGKVEGRGFFKYEASVDLGQVPMEIGRYYELHGEIARKGEEAFGNYTSLAILPEAAANSYKPQEIPFTSRTWDPRYEETVPLTHRLGIRICGTWGRMDADPAKVDAPNIGLIEEMGMGFLTGSPAHSVEQRNEGWEKLLADDGKLIRQGVRNFLKKYGHIKPMVVNLGNEPHAKGEEVKKDVEAYRIVYTEIKKIDPSVIVVGTSCGLEEDYFKYGFGQWLDAYDFHSYEDPEGVRTIVEKLYPQMFKKYGFAKPVWSTELGMNSQGMSRLAVASLVYKKFANFFAGGGVNGSWFGLFYPDPDAKIADSFGSAHNVFDARYSKYSPKMDAIAYYNVVNGIAIKKFAGDKVYDGDTHIFLFRDREGRALQICYKDRGRRDVFVPLAGVKGVEVIRLDGSRSTLDAEGKGVALTLSDEPLLLMYEGGPKTLPAKLEESPVSLAAFPGPFSRTQENIVEAEISGVTADQVELKAPPFWKVARVETGADAGKKAVRFSVTVPEESAVREGDMVLLWKGKGKDPRGQLSFRRAVTGLLTMDLMPVPSGEKGGPGVKMTVHNNSSQKQVLDWSLSLNGEQGLRKGEFTTMSATEASLGAPASGRIEVDAQSSAEVLIPIEGTKPVTVYHVRGTVRDAGGRVISQERAVAGFVPVPRAGGALTMDGLLDEESWKKAPVQVLDKAEQFYAFKNKASEAQTWNGPDDLSAEIRYLWDDDYFYVSVKVRDDIAGKIFKADSELWRQDGLQFLIDPARSSRDKPGKYEYSVGEGTKGLQVWCTLSADAGAPPGEARDIRFGLKHDSGGRGDATYEVAIPWPRLAPFKPGAGNNLGFTLIVNEDDGRTRDSYMTWFGNASSKDIDTVGDLILLP